MSARTTHTDEELEHQAAAIVAKGVDAGQYSEWDSEMFNKIFAEGVQLGMQLIKSHRDQYAEEAKIRSFESGYRHGGYDEMKRIEQFWTRQPFPGDDDTTMFIHNRVTELEKQLKRLAQLSPKDPNPKQEKPNHE